MTEGLQKAIVAIMGGMVVVINSLWDLNLEIDQDTINVIASVAMMILVYVVPNKKKGKYDVPER